MRGAPVQQQRLVDAPVYFSRAAPEPVEEEGPHGAAAATGTSLAPAERPWARFKEQRGAPQPQGVEEKAASGRVPEEVSGARR